MYGSPEESCGVVDNVSEAEDQCKEVETEGLRRQDDDLLASQRLMHSGDPDSATVLTEFASKRSNESSYLQLRSYLSMRKCWYAAPHAQVATSNSVELEGPEGFYCVENEDEATVIKRHMRCKPLWTSLSCHYHVPRS